MASDGHLNFDTSIDYAGILKGLKDLEKKLEGYTVGKDIFANLAADAIKAAGGAFSSAAQMGVEFEASMSRVQAVSGATADELENLTDLAREYGASTVFSSSECADALNYMAMAGWNVEQMTNGLPGILNLAAAAGEDLGTTSDIVTDALTAFGMSAEEAGHFADILATASSKSNTNVSMMGETFKYIAPVAGALGYSAEDVAVAVGLMANSGIKASQAGTSLRAILSNLTEPTDKQAEAMETLGISLTDSEGKMKSLDELMGDLRTGFSGLDEATQASYASIIGGQEAMSGLLAVVNASNTDFNNLKSAIYSCDGACDSMAETMTDNVSGELKTLQSMAEELQLSLYDMFQPALMKAIPKVQDAVGWITEHLDEIIAFAKPVSVALASIFAVNKAVKFCGAIKNIFSVINAGMSSNPVGMVFKAIEAVTVLGSAVIGLFDAMDVAMENVPDYNGTLAECADEIARTEAAYEKACEMYGENSDAVQKLSGQLETLNAQYEKGGGAIAEYAETATNAGAKLDELAKSERAAIEELDGVNTSGYVAVAMLESLSEKSDLTNADLGLMSTYADYLNDTFNCNIIVNYDTGTLTGFNPETIAAEIESMYNEKKITIAMEAVSNVDFVANYKDVFDAYENATQEYHNALDTYQKEADAAYQDFLKASHDYADENGSMSEMLSARDKWEELQAPIDDAKTALDTCTAKFEEADAQLKENCDIIDETGALYDLMAESMRNGADITSELTEATLELTTAEKSAAERAQDIASGQEAARDVMEQYTDEILELCQAYDEAYDAAYSSFQGQFGLFDKASTESEEYMNATVANAQAALDSQLAYWESYSANISILKDTSAADLNITQENYDALMSYVQSGSAEAAGLAESMVRELEQGHTDAVAELANTIGEIDAVQQENSQMVAEWQTQLDTEMQETIKAMQTAIQDLNLSDDAEAAAMDTMQGYINSITNSIDDARSAAQSVVDAVKSVFNSTDLSFSASGISGSVQVEGNARGTTNASDVFIAGENGPELVVGKKGSTVFPASETAKILAAVNSMVPDFSGLVLPSVNTAAVYSQLAAPSNPMAQTAHYAGTSASSPAAATVLQQGNFSPTFIVQIGGRQLDDYIIETIANENANSGGYTV